MLVQQPDEFFLVQAVYKAAHQGAQIGGGGRYGFAVPRNISEEQAAYATRGATGDVVDIATALGLAEKVAVNPDIETGQFDSAGGDLASAPNLHALHMLCRGSGHAGIIAAGRIWNRFLFSLWLAVAGRCSCLGNLHQRRSADGSIELNRAANLKYMCRIEVHGG